jgi:hypothetical protein
MISKEQVYREIQPLTERFAEQIDSYKSGEYKETLKIDYCENRINQLVYQFYNITPEEQKIIEGN